MKEFYYKCSKCGKTYQRDEVRYLCPECSQAYKPGEPLQGVLEAVFDYKAIQAEFENNGYSRLYLLPVEEEFFPPYPVGHTPFFKAERLSEELGLSDIWIKNDGLNPSGSLKDRASFMIVAEANRVKEDIIVTASTGNAASALAAVCAAGNKKAIIFVPEKAPKAKILQMKLFGAEVRKIQGTYDDAFKLSLDYTKDNPGLNRNTAYHPLTIEGKKTVALEIFEQNDFKMPDYVFVPVGDGVIINGVYKGFYDLKQCGLADRIPKIICVQAETSNAIDNYLKTGKYAPAHPVTLADSISVSAPSNLYLGAKAVAESNGFSILVTDTEIMEAQAKLARSTGVFAEPSSATVLAALEKAKTKIEPNAQIVLLITGNGLKDIDSPLKYHEVR